jgi:hypothetical protein
MWRAGSVAGRRLAGVLRHWRGGMASAIMDPGCALTGLAQGVDMSHGARLARYSEVSSSLALLSDRKLGRLVDEASSTGSGLGGTSAVVEVAGVPVFVKRVPLTDSERRPGSVMSTANLFGLPVFCQYGVGGPGFGAWRELAANAVTTGWVLARRTEAFPLMYHWRVLPGAAALAEELADVEGAVAYWGGSPAVRERISALAGASASVVLFAEYIPQVLRAWLGGQLDRGQEAVASACTMLERSLRAGLAFMNRNGLLHFDAHFGNILTDGQRLYFADLGLATSPRFDLSAAESDFVGRNLSHDVLRPDPAGQLAGEQCLRGVWPGHGRPRRAQRLHPPLRRRCPGRGCPGRGGGGDHKIRAGRGDHERLLPGPVREEPCHAISGGGHHARNSCHP